MLSSQNGSRPKEMQKEKSHFKCNLCKDTGYIITPKEHSQPIMTPCSCMEDDKVKRLWSNSGINTDNLDKTFSNFEECFR